MPELQNWLFGQVTSMTRDWSGAIEQHYPEAVPTWRDPDLFLLHARAAFFPALSVLDFGSLLPSANARVLDLGSGSGWLSGILSARPEIAQIDALDSDEFNLRTLMPAVVERLDGDLGKIRPVLGLFEPIMEPDDTYDLIVASSSIHHSTNMFRTLREMRRVLKPNGALLMLNEIPRADYHSYILNIIYHLLKDSLEYRSSEFSHGLSNAGILFDACLGDHAYAPFQYEDALLAAGFSVEIIDSGHALNQESADAGRTLKHLLCRPSEGVVEPKERHPVDPAVNDRIKQVMALCGEGIDFNHQIEYYKEQVRNNITRADKLETRIGGFIAAAADSNARADQLETRIGGLIAAAAESDARADQLETRIGGLIAAAAESDARAGQFEARIGGLIAAAAESDARADRLQNELDAIKNSTTWRLTAPVRKAASRFPSLARALRLGARAIPTMSRR